jgi:hypothetical protein
MVLEIKNDKKSLNERTRSELRTKWEGSEKPLDVEQGCMSAYW